MTYPLFGQEFSDNGTQHPGERPDAVGETHQDTGEPRGNVQVIHIESYNTQLKVQQKKHSIYNDIKTIHDDVTNSENKYQKRFMRGAHASIAFSTKLSTLTYMYMFSHQDSQTHM